MGKLTKITDEITYHLMPHVQGCSKSLVVPNLYYRGFEMDVVKYDYYRRNIHEYEVKSNYRDFATDKDKSCPVMDFIHGWHDSHSCEWPYDVTLLDVIGELNDRYSKHKLIQDGYYGIDRFTYVCPLDVIPKSEVPDIYGLIYYCSKQNKFHTIQTASRIRVKSDFRPGDIERKIVEKMSRIIFYNRQKIHRLMGNKDSQGFKKVIS
jgi:hypothetical protein